GEERKVRQVGMLLERELHQDGDLVVGHPGLAGGLYARPRPAAATVDLAPLHREVDVIAARIAGDDLHPGAEHAVDDAGELVGVGGGAGAAHGQFVGQEIFKPGDLGASVPHDADAHLVVGAADPVELGAVELRGLAAEQRIKAGTAPDGAEHEAVLGCDVEEPVGEPQAAGAIHVLGRHHRIARDVFAEVTGDHSGVDVVAAAHAVADHQVDVLAFVEVGRALRVASRGWSDGKKRRREYVRQSTKPHGNSP